MIAAEALLPALGFSSIRELMPSTPPPTAEELADAGGWYTRKLQEEYKRQLPAAEARAYALFRQLPLSRQRAYIERLGPLHDLP